MESARPSVRAVRPSAVWTVRPNRPELDYPLIRLSAHVRGYSFIRLSAYPLMCADLRLSACPLIRSFSLYLLLRFSAQLSSGVLPFCYHKLMLSQGRTMTFHLARDS